MTKKTKITEKQVTLKITSSKGHDEFVGTAKEALDRLLEEAENGKWVFIDGRHAAPESVTLDALTGAKDITLTNSLVGG